MSTEPNKQNIAQLIEGHEWNEGRGGAWFIEDFMAYHGIWFTDFRKDVAKALAGLTPKKLADEVEVRRHLLAHLKPKLLGAGATPKDISEPARPVQQATKAKEPLAYDYKECQEVVEGSASKNEAMWRLRKAGYANKDIANFMKCKPGRVASGIGSYSKSQARKEEKPEKKVQSRPPDLW